MPGFELDAQGWQDMLSHDDAHLGQNPEIEPTVFQGTARAVGAGVMRGGARVAQFMGTLGSVPAVLAEKSLGTEGILTDAYFHKLDDVANDAVDFWTPDPHTMGAGARAVGGFSEIALPLMATAGNPALLVGSQQVGTSVDLVRQGVDANTAVGVGAVAGLSTAAGFKVPIIGKTLAQRMAAGAAGNVLLNAGATGIQHEILDQRGYEQLAENYDPADVGARVTDVLSGLVFGALYHATQPSKVAGTATVNNAKHYQVDTAPGRIETVEASAAHQAAIGDAIEQNMRGEPTNVPREVLDAEFKPRPPREVPIPPEYREIDANLAARRDSGPEVTVETSDNGRQLTLRTENGFTEARIKGGEYLQIANTETAEGGRGKGEGTARMRQLVEIAQERNLTLASDTKVSPQAARFYDRLAREGFTVIRNAAKADSEGHLVSEDSKPIFEVHPKGGGYSGAHGNATGIRSELPADQNLGATREGVAQGAGSASNGGAATRTVRAFRGGVGELTAGEFGRGAVEGATTQPTSGLGVRFSKSAEHAADFGQVSEHQLTFQNPKVIKVEDLPYFRTAKEYRDYANVLRAQGYDALAVSAAHHKGPVEYFAFDQSQVGGLAKEAKPAAKAEVDPDVAAAHAAIEAAGDKLMVPTGAIDAEGKPVTRSAREVMAEAEAGIKEAENDARGFEAAVSCWIARGPDAS